MIATSGEDRLRRTVMSSTTSIAPSRACPVGVAQHVEPCGHGVALDAAVAHPAMLKATSSAVKGSPLLQVTPGRTMSV
jgi:hypothetical protein